MKNQIVQKTLELENLTHPILGTIYLGFETGDEEVIVDNNETRIDHEFIKMVNRELGPGYKGNLRLAGDRQNLGAGFILRRGKINNNVSLNVLLSQAKKELEIELAKDLFEN